MSKPVPGNRHHCISRAVVLLIVQARWPVSNSACDLPRTAAFSSPTAAQGAGDVPGSLACTFGPSTRRWLWLRPALGHVGVVRLPVRLVAPTRRQCSPLCRQGRPCSSCCRHPDWPATVNRALYHPDASSVGTRLLARDTRVSVVAGSARISAPRPMRTTCLLSLPRSSRNALVIGCSTRLQLRGVYRLSAVECRLPGLCRPLDLLPRLERVPPHLCWLVVACPKGTLKVTGFTTVFADVNRKATRANRGRQKALSL